MKLSDAKRDFYRNKAKKEGYVSRAAYKLIQLNQKYKILNNGDIVVDFGSAPGGWIQVASDYVGSSGFVLGIDQKDIKYYNKNVKNIISDIYDPEIHNIITNYLPKKADIVLSDISQNISGIWDLDHFKQIDLTKRIISFFPQIIRNHGTAILKVFTGAEVEKLISKLKTGFKKVEIGKPQASRSRSSELYLICLNYNNKVIEYLNKVELEETK